MTKIAREARRRDGAGHARAGAAGERYYGECDQDKAVETDLVYTGTTLQLVDEKRNLKIGLLIQMNMVFLFF